MSLIGKILAGLCIVAAFAFMYLATVDRGKRQEWSYAVFRHDLADLGLPLEREQRDPLLDVPVVDQIGDKTLQQLGKDAGGKPVKRTQQEETTELRDRLRADLDRLDGDAAKQKRLVEILTPLARTLGERQGLPQRTKDELMAEFDRTFNDALRPVYDPTTGKPTGQRDVDQKRHAIAHLFYNLGRDETDQQHALVVVGLREYALEANRQADALAEMGRQVRVAMDHDRGTFVPSHANLIKEIQLAAQRLEGHRTALATQQQLRKKNEDLVALRKKDVSDLQKKLEGARQDTQETLARQGQFEKALFDAQRRLRDAVAMNKKLEEEIRARENAGR